MRIARRRTSLEWRNKILVQDDHGDCRSCFLSRALFSLNGILFDESSVSRIPTTTSVAVNAPTTADVPYVTDSPNSDSLPAPIAPVIKPQPDRAAMIPKVELMRSGFDTEISLRMT